MSWDCNSCGTQNSSDQEVCSKCGSRKGEPPRRFYKRWLFRATFLFTVFYLAGTTLGGLIIATIATPNEAEMLFKANKYRDPGTPEFKSLEELNSDEQTAAKAMARAMKIENMHWWSKPMIQWLLMAFLFVVCGALVGYMADGTTIWEAGLGSLFGQALGLLLVEYLLHAHLTSWLIFGFGTVPGVALAAAGAWWGENRKKR